MTRKDFELVAGAIATIDNKRARTLAARALVNKLRHTNPRFDSVRFLRACGVAK